MAGAGWESQPAHNVPSSVTVEVETSMSRQEGPVGKRKLQKCRLPQRGGSPKTSRLCRRALTHCAVGGQGLVGQYHLEWGQEDQNGCLSICSKPFQGLLGSQDRRTIGGRTSHPTPQASPPAFLRDLCFGLARRLYN